MKEYRLYEKNSGTFLGKNCFSKKDTIDLYNKIKNNYEEEYNEKLNQHYNIEVIVTEKSTYCFDEFLKL